MKTEIRLIDQEQRDRADQDLSESYIVEAAAGTGKTTVLVTRIINLIREGGAGLDPNFEVADELTAFLLRAEVWEEWFEKQMDANDPALRRAVLIGITPEQIHKISQSMLENRDVLQYLPPIPPSEELEKTIWQFVKSFQESINSLNHLKEDCKNQDGDRAAQKIDQLNEQLLKLQSLPQEEREIFIFKEIFLGSPNRLGNKTNWTDQGHLKRVREQMSSLLEMLDKTKATLADSVLTTLGKQLIHYIETYEQAKRERNFLDFQDLLIYARRTLKEHFQVRQYFRERYKFLLVDEFQDTDPLQAEIVFFLSEGEKGRASEWKDVQVSPKRLFLVGDPKQSIYRFRRADIEMYEEAKTRMGGSRLLNISQNFRCAPSIVRVVNRIFQDLIKPPEDGQYQPGYVSLHFGRKGTTVPQEHGTVLLYPPGNENIVMNSADDCRLWESRCIASFIQKLVSEEKWQVWDDSDQSFRPVMFRDIAILMRTYTPLDPLEEALRSYEVEYRVVGGKYFYKRQEVQQLLTVLQAIDNPHDKVSLVAALRSPFFGISDEELFLFHARGGNLIYLQEAQGTVLEQPFRLLRELHEMRNQASVAALLKKLYEATSGLVLFLLKPQGEQRVANLLKIGDVARALSERGMLSFRGFVRWLSERQKEEAEEEEPPMLERGDNFVRLVTIHRAKGLEFPVVILVDLSHKAGGREDFIIDRNGERIAIKVGPKDSRFWTCNYEEMSDWEEKRGEAEERRLLYVAMTRARDFLVLPVYWVKEKKNGEKDVPEGSFLHYLQPYITLPDKVSFGKRNEDMMFYDTSKLELKPEETAPFRSPLNPEMEGGEASRLMLSQREKWKETQDELKMRAGMGRPITTATEQVGAQEEVEKDDEWVMSPVTKGEGAVFGKLVHSLFEKLDWSQPDLLEKMAEIEGQDLGASGPMIKKATEMIREALSSSLFQRIIKSGNYQKEVPFAYKDNGTIFEGIMDVVFREEDGLVVLDFKTDLMERDNLNSKVEHYKPQAQVYSDAIKTIFGQPPKEVILFFLHLMEPVSAKINK